MNQRPVVTEFDNYAESYDAALALGLSVTGEDKSYFARGRISWLASCLQRLGEKPRLVLNYGCGTGSEAPILLDAIAAEHVIGVDISKKSVDIARRIYSSGRTGFLQSNEYQPSERMDLVYCNGVFHHIPPRERLVSVEYVYACLHRGGLFALWENNPWNPGTRYVMSRIPFDRDAVMLAPIESRRMLESCGFQILRTDFLFLFPRFLRFFRGLEPLVSKLPLGAQYQVLCRKS